MNLTECVKNIFVNPNQEWPVIEKEAASVADLYTSYIMPLAAIGLWRRLSACRSLESARLWAARIAFPLAPIQSSEHICRRSVARLAFSTHCQLHACR
jgi:hypothetical protein